MILFCFRRHAFGPSIVVCECVRVCMCVDEHAPPEFLMVSGLTPSNHVRCRDADTV